MPFVKLDCGILDSTLWVDRYSREAFITALLMAEPYETEVPLDQIEVRTLDKTGWTVPPGKYGYVRAAGAGIVRRAGLDHEEGMEALIRLGNPEPDSRSPAFDGRRLIRVDGGYIILNYFTYRDRDYTAAERQKRYRARNAVTRDVNTVTRNITHAEAEAEAEAYSLRSGSAGDLSPSSSDRANGSDVLTKRRSRKRSLDAAVADFANGHKLP